MKAHAKREPLQAELEAAKPTPDVVFRGYNNLFLQYGFVVFFGAVWPLAALLVFISCLVQTRVTAKSLCVLYQRPRARDCPGLGPWNSVFVLMTFVAVATNCGMVCFTSSFLSISAVSEAGRVAGFIVSEHLLLMIFLVCYTTVGHASAVTVEQVDARRKKIQLHLSKLRRLQNEAAFLKLRTNAASLRVEESGVCPYVETERELWTQHRDDATQASADEARP